MNRTRWLLAIVAAATILICLLHLAQEHRYVKSRVYSHVLAGLMLFQLDHQGFFPANIDELAQSGYLSSEEVSVAKPSCVYMASRQASRELPPNAILGYFLPEHEDARMSIMLNNGTIDVVSSSLLPQLKNHRISMFVLLSTDDATSVAPLNEDIQAATRTSQSK